MGLEPETSPEVPMEDLVRAARGGDASGLDALHQRIGPALLAWACLRVPRALRSRLDPEDLVQEVWCRILGTFPAFDASRGNFRQWVFGIASHVLLKALRTGPLRAAAGGEQDSWIRRSEDSTSVGSRLARKEEIQAFVGRLSDLDDLDRRLLVHRAIEGRDHREVALLLGISPDSTRKRWQRLQERLRERAPAPDFFVP